MSKYIVYKHTSPSGKVYIGLTSKKNPKDRWKYGYGYKHNRYFYNAIRKYGWNNIKHEIVASNLTQEEANLLEKKLIAYYKEREICYNIAEGGDDGNTMKRTEKEKEHLRRASKEYFKTHTHPFLGKHHSIESKKKMQKVGKKHWEENYEEMYLKVVKLIKVGVYNIITKDYMEFNSEKEAAHLLNIKETTFRRHINSGSIIHNYILFPLDTVSFEEALLKAYKREQLHIHCGGQEKKVVQLDFKGNYLSTFSSIKEASILTKINVSCIGSVCREKYIQAGGYFWMFESKYIGLKNSSKLNEFINKLIQCLNSRKSA